MVFQARRQGRHSRSSTVNCPLFIRSVPCVYNIPPWRHLDSQQHFLNFPSFLPSFNPLLSTILDSSPLNYWLYFFPILFLSDVSHNHSKDDSDFETAFVQIFKQIHSNLYFVSSIVETRVCNPTAHNPDKAFVFSLTLTHDQVTSLLGNTHHTGIKMPESRPSCVA